MTAMLTQRSIVGFFDSARLLTCRCSMDSRDSTRSALISSTSGAQRVEISQSRDVVGSHGQGERLVDLVQPSDHHLSHSTDHLRLSEALLDALPFAQMATDLRVDAPKVAHHGRQGVAGLGTGGRDRQPTGVLRAELLADAPQVIGVEQQAFDERHHRLAGWREPGQALGPRARISRCPARPQARGSAG